MTRTVERDRTAQVEHHAPVSGVGPVAPTAIHVTHMDSPVEPTTSGAAASGADDDLGPSAPGGRAPARVVVGVNGSRRSVVALRWALDHAAQRGWSVDVVTVWPDPDEVFVHEVPGHYCAPRGRAVQAQDLALVDVGAEGPSAATVRTFVDNALALEALVSHGAGASMIVVGEADPDRGARRREALGETCAGLASCPVVVVSAAATSTQGHPGA